MDRLHYWLRDDWLYLPFARKLEIDGLEIYTIDEFLSKEECRGLVSVIKSRLRPSEITQPNPDILFRTSSSCDLGVLDGALVQEIDTRISRTMGIHSNFSEFMQGQFYLENQQFKPHPDYFNDLDFKDHCYPQGQRT